MVHLNLPKATFKLRKGKNDHLEIFDIVRKKFVKLTPEEWVRQHFIHYLTNHLQYPVSLITSESGIKTYNRNRRTDVVVFTNTGKTHILIECKSFEKNLSENAWVQISAYYTQIHAEYIVLSNGIHHAIFQNKRNQWKCIHELPMYVPLIQETKWE